MMVLKKKNPIVDFSHYQQLKHAEEGPYIFSLFILYYICCYRQTMKIMIIGTWTMMILNDWMGYCFSFLPSMKVKLYQAILELVFAVFDVVIVVSVEH